LAGKAFLFSVFQKLLKAMLCLDSIFQKLLKACFWAGLDSNARLARRRAGREGLAYIYAFAPATGGRDLHYCKLALNL
jgi:hypothetical protein